MKRSVASHSLFPRHWPSVVPTIVELSAMPDMEDMEESFCSMVLCIDDDWDLLKLEKLILETAGYAVLLANDAAEGMNLAKSSRVDLVVLDGKLPRMTRTEVAERLRSTQPALPIIIIFDVGLPERSTKMVDHCLLKAKIVMTLVREVKRLLSNKRARRYPSPRPSLNR